MRGKIYETTVYIHCDSYLVAILFLWRTFAKSLSVCVSKELHKIRTIFGKLLFTKVNIVTSTMIFRLAGAPWHITFPHYIWLVGSLAK